MRGGGSLCFHVGFLLFWLSTCQNMCFRSDNRVHNGMPSPQILRFMSVNEDLVCKEDFRLADKPCMHFTFVTQFLPLDLMPSSCFYLKKKNKWNRKLSIQLEAFGS